MQSYLVIPVFIRPLLVMVIEDGGQNRVHLGEPLALVFEGSWAGRQGGGGGKGVGSQESACVGASPFTFRGWGPALHPAVYQKMLTVLLAGFQPAFPKWTTRHTSINMLSPSH